MHKNKGRIMSATDEWVTAVKDVLEQTGQLSTQEYHDGLEEILEEVEGRYEGAKCDLERAEEEDDE
jgi:hypothetical protein